MSDDYLKKQFGRYLTGWAFSMAILDDYCEVISKIEGVNASIVKERITKNANEKFHKANQSG